MLPESPSSAQIRVLPRLLVDQIAAGEVVERPASVVRELLDNAIDAGARNITIEIEDGGRGLIRISDDGSGIRYKDLPLAFASHATSKLYEIDDLQQIATLGFRGEALASIGAVARARVRSCAEGEAHAGEIEDEGGVISAARPAARARGTDVEVRDLFYNVPARRRFLRRDTTETGHSLDVLLRHALARPEIAFKVFVDGKLQYDLPAAQSLATAEDLQQSRLDRIRAAFGGDVAKDMKAVSIRGRSAAIEGFVGGPATARSDAQGVHLYLNGRFIKDRGALHVLREATRDVLGAKQPRAFLFLSMDPALADVNVHPAKLEVRFREPSAVYGILHSGVRRALEGARPAAPADLLLNIMKSPASGAPAGGIFEAADRDLVEFEARESAAAAAPPQNQDLYYLQKAEPLVPRAARFLRAFDTFLVVESPEGIDMIDQHALHERVNFERLRAQARGGEAPRQKLLIPEMVRIGHEDAGIVEEFSDVWRRAGLQVMLAGPVTAAIHATPLGLKYVRPPELLKSLIELAKNNKFPGAEELLEEVLHRCACHASVKAGDRLNDDEIADLLLQASRLPAEQTCPHGRPTRIRFTLRDFERAFERK